MSHRCAAVLVLAGIICLGASGCSADEQPEPAPTLAQPALTDFAAGACQAAAPDVLAVGREVFALGEGPSAPPEVQKGLVDSQQRLNDLVATAPPEVAPALQEMVVSIGLVRLRAVGSALDASVLRTLGRDYDAVVQACAPAWVPPEPLD